MVTKRAVIFCGITGLQQGISVTSTYKAHHRISIKSEIFAKHLHATAATLVNKQANKIYSWVRLQLPRWNYGLPYTSEGEEARWCYLTADFVNAYCLRPRRERMATGWGFSRGDRGRALFLQLPRRLTTARGLVKFISARSFTFAALSVKTRMTGALIIVR